MVTASPRPSAPRPSSLGSAALALALLAGASPALAVQTIDFNTLPPGASVTNQFPGVVFSVVNAVSPGDTPLVGALGSATSSPSNNLTAPGDGAGDSSPEFLRMQFTNPQRRVQFTTGRGFGLAGTGSSRVRVRWFNNLNTLLGTRFVSSTDFACQAFVNLGSDTGPANISRVDIQTFNDNQLTPEAEFEYIDDLTYRADVTAPLVSIASPVADTCICNNPVITGVQCDADGTLVSRRVEFGTSPNGPWTLITSATTGVCSVGTLASWNTAALPSGQYYIRASAINAEGDESEFITRVVLDKSAPAAVLRAPAAELIASTTVCFDGTVDDGGCSNPSYRVQWSTFPAGVFNPVNPSQPVYTGSVINDPLGNNWNISSLPDGPYVVRLSASDACGNASALVERRIVVDNTRPIAIINSPEACSKQRGIIRIAGTAFDANLSGWVLQIAGGPFSSWETFATSSANVVNGTLSFLDTDTFPPCAYAVRLLVNDRASVSCSGNTQNAEFVRTFRITESGQCEDIDFNNDGLFPDDNDLLAFLSVLAGGSCTP